MDDLYTIIEFNENDKWFVIGTTTYNLQKYNYLMRVNPQEDDLLNEFMVVHCITQNQEEYFDVVKEKQLLQKIIPLMLPIAQKVIDNPKQSLKELLKI